MTPVPKPTDRQENICIPSSRRSAASASSRVSCPPCCFPKIVVSFGVPGRQAHPSCQAPLGADGFLLQGTEMPAFIFLAVCTSQSKRVQFHPAGGPSATRISEDRRSGRGRAADSRAYDVLAEFWVACVARRQKFPHSRPIATRSGPQMVVPAAG